jgi:hypothetical protein
MSKHPHRSQQELELKLLEARLTERRIAVLRQVVFLILLVFVVGLTLAMSLGLLHGVHIHIEIPSLLSGGG